MILFAAILLPAVAGGAVWVLGRRGRSDRRLLLGGTGVGALAGTAALAAFGWALEATGSYDRAGPLRLVIDTSGSAGPVAVLVPAIAAVVVAWAAAHEPAGGLPRLLGLLTSFAGAMEVVVTAADLLTLTVGFELVGGLSWGLIGHDWQADQPPKAAAHAFNATRFGTLGLFLAGGAAVAGTTAAGQPASLAFADLHALTGTNLHVLVGGVLLAAVAKSGQLPFSPWLFSAMQGPTPVSALLHSSTMVAAGAYALIRLHPVLDGAAWFAPVTIGIGLVTALAGGVVALLNPHIKQLLAASTSAQYGLMFVAVGAGHPAVAAIHLVVHAVFKSQLFLSAGVAIRAAGSPQLGTMRLGGRLRATSAVAAVGALALAAVPPLGGAWSKEAVTAAAGELNPWLAVGVIVAGGLSAAYATRLHVLAFGRPAGDQPTPRPPLAGPGRVELAALAILAACSVLLGLLWIPAAHEGAARLLGGSVPASKPWELALAIAVLALAAYVVWTLDRAHRLGHVGLGGRSAAAADWLGLPAVVHRGIVDPSLALARRAAELDDQVLARAVAGVAAGAQRVSGALAGAVDTAANRATLGVGRGAVRLSSVQARTVEPALDRAVGLVARTGRSLAPTAALLAERGVDAAVAGTTWLVERAGGDARRTHTGMVHHQFIVIAVGVALAVVAVAAGR